LFNKKIITQSFVPVCSRIETSSKKQIEVLPALRWPALAPGQLAASCLATMAAALLGTGQLHASRSSTRAQAQWHKLSATDHDAKLGAKIAALSSAAMSAPRQLHLLLPLNLRVKIHGTETC
jgi:hypothetical protein